MNIQMLSFIYLYNGASTTLLNAESLVEYLRVKFPKFQVESRPNITDYYLSQVATDEREDELDSLAKRLSICRVRNVEKPWLPANPLYGEISYEKRRLQGKAKGFGVMYDGVALASLFYRLIKSSERASCHITLTDQLLGTWDEDNRRYHARVGIFSQPSILSTTGVVEAPAKPREFYLLKGQIQTLGTDYLAVARLKEQFKGSFIDYDDERVTEAMKGYVMQAVFNHLTGNPFCPNPNCRLFNAHWQEELIKAQLESEEEFCEEHRKILERCL